jgi:hypothetical protein
MILLVTVEQITGCDEEETEDHNPNVYGADEIDPEGESVVYCKVHIVSGGMDILVFVELIL